MVLFQVVQGTQSRLETVDTPLRLDRSVQGDRILSRFLVGSQSLSRVVV